MIDKHKVLEAFWIMFNTAKEKNREISIYRSSAYIYANKDEGVGQIAKIEFKTHYIEEEIAWYKRNIIKSINYIEGYVIHPTTSKRFNFNFSDKMRQRNQ